MKKIPFLWEVKKNGNVSYLFGTAHLIDEHGLFEATKEIINNSKVVYVECSKDLKFEDEHILMNNGDSLSSFLEPADIRLVNNFFVEQYSKFMNSDDVKDKIELIQKQKIWWTDAEAKSIAYNGEEIKYLAARRDLSEMEKMFKNIGTIPNPARVIKLYNIVAAFENKEDKSPPSLDNSIRTYAEISGKEVKGLDEIEKYVVVKDSVSIETQIYGLLDSIEKMNSGDFFDDEEVELYKERNVDKILEKINNANSHEKEFYEKLGDGRNALWYPKTEKDIAEGGAFIAVGLSHLITEKGYVALLKKDGYEVNPV